MKKFILIFMCITILLIGCGLDPENEKPVDSSNLNSVIVTIPRGSTTTSIGNLLTEKKLIHNSNIFEKIVKDKGYDGKLQAGDYSISPSNSLEEIIEKIYSGETYIETVTFTIPEGLELDEITQKLLDDKIIKDKDSFKNTLSEEISKYELIKNIDYINLEGFLFPDTYEVKKNHTDKDVIHLMLNRFVKVFDEEMLNKINESEFSFYEILALASVIEREIVLDNERVIASGVFHNRLEKGMKLQSCATVQYIINERKPILSGKDISIDNPYNTYKNLGLPPGPICSPGEASIKAAVFPERTDYLYFVRSYKNDDSHIFSTNFKDHEKARIKLMNEGGY